MQLLREFNSLKYSPEEIKKNKEKSGKITLSGLFQRADALNQNGRVYPMDILAREVRNYQKFIRERRSTGECDHPDSSVVNLKNVSHLITSLDMDEDGAVYGKLELLDTPSGLIAQKLVEAGVSLGVSSRGVGSTTSSNNADLVQDDFILITFDLVSEPSTSGAILMREGKNINPSELRNVLSKSDRIDRIVNDIVNWK